MADDSNDKPAGTRDKRKQGIARDPAKHSKKDPAKPTRAKASRPELAPIEPALEKLLNPGIGQGTAGPGSQTGLKPPPDNSFDRRADFSAAHRARKSTQGFEEASQAGYAGKVSPGEIDPDLAKALGITDDENDPHPNPPPFRGREQTERGAKDAGLASVRGVTGASATVHALETLLREGRPEFGERPWTPHRPPRPEKSEGGQPLVIKSEFEPKGDQPQAIRDLVEGVKRQDRTQVLLGVTGSGKTFTMAKVIEETQRPALVLAPNKTLAAQLYGEFRSFFPDNAVEYFVSYYDYYQPEAYVPRTGRASPPASARRRRRAMAARVRHRRTRRRRAWRPSSRRRSVSKPTMRRTPAPPTRTQSRHFAGSPAPPPRCRRWRRYCARAARNSASGRGRRTARRGRKNPKADGRW